MLKEDNRTGRIFTRCWGWVRRLRQHREVLSKRRDMKIRLTTVLLWAALLLGLHVLLARWQNQTPFPSDRNRVSRPGFAPRRLVRRQLCHGLPRNVGSINNTTKHTTKVLLLTYLRAGASLVGQLFDKDLNTTYWSEPVDGILSDLYGTYHGWHPLDVFTNKEGHPRRVPQCEEEAIVAHLSSLYDCRLEDLPADVLTAPEAILPSWKTKRYDPCLHQTLVDVRPHNNPSGFSSNVMLACKELVVQLCPKAFSYAHQTLYNCFEKIQDLKSKMGYLTNHVMGLQQRDGPLWVETAAEDPFLEYGKCLASVRHHGKKCLPLFESLCNQSDMTVVKSSRLRGEQVTQLMERHPDLHIIYFVRDPRAMALSREKTGMLSEVSQASYVNEAVLICQRMHYDMAHLEVLAQRYRHQVMRLSFEELLQDPQTAANSVYSFLQREMSDKVKGWVKFKMDQLIEEGPDGVMTLKNMTGIAFKWRRQMPKPDNDYILRKCAHVLHALNYPLLR